MNKHHLQAQPMLQPTFQVAPEAKVQAILATAPTMQKGFGSSIGLGTWQQNHQQQAKHHKLFFHV